MNGNGHKRIGRPGIADEPSEPVSVRLPRSQWDVLDKLARDRGVTKPELIRMASTVIVELQTEVDQLNARLDQLVIDFASTATATESLMTSIRLAMVRSECPDVVSTLRSYMERFPTDKQVPRIGRLLEVWRRTNSDRPGSVTQDQLWKAVGM